MQGYVKNLMRLGDKGYVTIELDYDDAINVCERVQEDLCDINIKRHKEIKKRSLDANNYLWALIGEIAKAIKQTPVDVYRDFILDYGVYENTNIDVAIYPLIKESWQMRGLGWQVIEVDKTAEKINVNLYVGSSHYDTAEMSKLVDAVVEQAKTLGIETLSARELSLLKDEWKCNP